MGVAACSLGASELSQRGVGRLPPCLSRMWCGGGADLSTREGGQQDHPVTSGGREEPISRARGSQCLLPSCYSWNTHAEVTAFSLESVASQTQAAEARLPPPGLPALAGPVALAQLLNLGLATHLRTQTKARSRTHGLRMHLTTCRPSLGYSRLT